MHFQVNNNIMFQQLNSLSNRGTEFFLATQHNPAITVWNAEEGIIWTV